MPFTPSHAVVALAFTRTPLVPAAVAVGAMAPDVPLFVRLAWPDYAMTHDLAWLPVTTVLAAFLLVVWRCILRGAVGDLVPVWVARRLPVEWDRSAAASFRETFALRGDPEVRPGIRGTLLVIAALATGVASHIVWDLFTHEGRWGSVLIPALDAPWGPLVGVKWLQHGSSVAGLVVLGVWMLVHLLRAHPRPITRRLPVWVAVAVWLALPMALIAGWLVGLAVWGPFTGEWTPAHLGYRVLPPVCTGWALLALVVCLTRPPVPTRAAAA